MPVSQPALSSSIDLSGLPVRVLEALTGLAAVCRAPLAAEPCPAAFEEAEHRIRESVNALGCEVLGAWIESLDDGALRVERAGQRRFRVAATPKTIMSTLGPVTYRRARYRHGASRASLVPVDESLGLVNDWLTRPAARLGLMMMGHCTAREAEEFFSEVGAMTPSASTLQRLAYSLHERWEGLGPQALESIRNTEDIPPGAVSASVSLDGVMVALRAGEDGRAEACWREAACGTVSFHDREGERLKTLYLARMPESGKHTLKAQLASEVAHIRLRWPRRARRRLFFGLGKRAFQFLKGELELIGMKLLGLLPEHCPAQLVEKMFETAVLLGERDHLGAQPLDNASGVKIAQGRVLGAQRLKSRLLAVDQSPQGRRKR